MYCSTTQPNVEAIGDTQNFPEVWVLILFRHTFHYLNTIDYSVESMWISSSRMLFNIKIRPPNPTMSQQSPQSNSQSFTPSSPSLNPSHQVAHDGLGPRLVALSK